MQFIYLDQMAWINLAKKTKSNSELFQYFKNLVDNKKVTFPLSLSHFIETTKAPRLDQRKSLSFLMNTLSKGIFISNDRKHTTQELENAFIDFFELQVPKRNIEIFTEDLFEIFGERILNKIERFDDIPRAVKALLSTPTGIHRLLSSSDEDIRNNYLKKYYSFTRRVKEEDQKYLEKIRGRSKEEIKRIYAAKLMIEFLEEINLMLDKFPLNKSDLMQISPKEGMNLTSLIPTLHVELELTVLRNIQWTREIDKNDLDDLSFLRIAIPYCDYIVTEKFWGNLANQANLGKRYQTKFLNNLNELKLELEN